MECKACRSEAVTRKSTGSCLRDKSSFSDERIYMVRSLEATLLEYQETFPDQYRDFRLPQSNGLSYPSFRANAFHIVCNRRDA